MESSEENENKYLRPEGIANRLGLSKPTVYRLLKRGELGHIRICGSILVTIEHLRAFLSKHEHPPL